MLNSQIDEQVQAEIEEVLLVDAQTVEEGSTMLAEHLATLPQRLRTKAIDRIREDAFANVPLVRVRLQDYGGKPNTTVEISPDTMREICIPITLEGLIIRVGVVLLSVVLLAGFVNWGFTQVQPIQTEVKQ